MTSLNSHEATKKLQRAQSVTVKLYGAYVHLEKCKFLIDNETPNLKQVVKLSKYTLVYQENYLRLQHIIRPEQMKMVNSKNVSQLIKFDMFRVHVSLDSYTDNLNSRILFYKIWPFIISRLIFPTA